MSEPALVQTPTTDHLRETYIDPETAQTIIDHIADLKRKTALAEEQLIILRQENTD